MDIKSKDVIRQVKRYISTATDLQEWPECWNSLLDMLSSNWHPAFALPYHAYQVVNGQAGGIISVTAAWLTLLHAAYLIDDLQDGNLERLTKTAPPDTALTYAIAWIFAAYRMLDDPAIRLEKRNQVINIISQAGFDSAHGQNLEFSQKTEILNGVDQLKAYWQSVVDKSGSIYAAGASVGAVIGTDSKDWIEALSDYGTSLGVLMQVIDDCRDFSNDTQQPNKSSTLPKILHELTTGHKLTSNPKHKTWSEVLTDSELEITQVLQDADIPFVIGDILLEWRRRGLESLSIFERSSSRDSLTNLDRKSVV